MLSPLLKRVIRHSIKRLNAKQGACEGKEMACKAKNMLELKIFCMTQAQAIRALRPGGAKFCAA